MLPELAFQLGRAAGAYFSGEAGVHRFLVGRDTRISGTLIEAALASGLCASGIDVDIVGVIPTPGVAYLTRVKGYDAGVVISASHNPFPDNGIKFFDSHGFKLPDATEEKIEELLYIVYKEFSMDGMLSDIMEEFKKRDIVFESDRQMERFAPIMMEVNNNTRMLDFRGYTPNEVSRVEQAAAPAPVAPAMPSFVPMANTPAVNMQPKKKVYPNDPCPCGSGKKYKKCCGRN